MDIFSHVRSFVLADAAIAAQISTRLYPIKLPQGVDCPAMTLQRISGVLISPLHGQASLARPRYQFDIWTREGVASAFSTCQMLGRLLKDRLEGQTIMVADDSQSPVEVRQVAFQFDSERDGFEEGDVNGGYYRYSTDYFIWYQTGRGST